MVLGDNGGRDRIHPWVEDIVRYGSPKGLTDVPPELDEIATGLAGRPGSGFGHDALDRYVATKKILAAAGLPEDWWKCPTCQGEGDSATPEQKAAHDAWTPTPPPEGEGWQLWQTVSEGGPVSPVFATADGLVEWMTANGYSEAASRKFVETGYSLGSFMMTASGKFIDGVEALVDRG